MCNLQNRVSDGDKQVKGNMILSQLHITMRIRTDSKYNATFSAGLISSEVFFGCVLLTRPLVFPREDVVEIAPQCRIFLMVIMSIQSWCVLSRRTIEEGGGRIGFCLERHRNRISHREKRSWDEEKKKNHINSSSLCRILFYVQQNSFLIEIQIFQFYAPNCANPSNGDHLSQIWSLCNFAFI